MSNTLKILLAQLHIRHGDLPFNYKRITSAIRYGEMKDADVIVTPELSVLGYNLQDLFLSKLVREQEQHVLHALQQEVQKEKTHVIVGATRTEEERIYNTAAVLSKDAIEYVKKNRLPNYEVFQENRFFTPSQEKKRVLEINGYKVGIAICEDIWTTSHDLQEQFQEKFDVLIAINASPFSVHKPERRKKLLQGHARHLGAWLIYVNLVGAQDELVFDGGSYIIDPQGKVVTQAPLFKQSFLVFTLHEGKGNVLPNLKAHDETSMNETQQLFHALRWSLREYFFRNKFKGAIIGLSGGIDSALTAALSIKSLGRKNVHIVYLPSKYSSKLSTRLVHEFAKNNRLELQVIEIDPVVSLLQEIVEVEEGSITHQNLQARTRGIILMGLANKHGYLLLSTGNKDELAVGYATLYGDMAGGWNLLGDLYKENVRALARFMNREHQMIPEEIITRPPSAELKHDQQDEADLMPYDELDALLKRLIPFESTEFDSRIARKLHGTAYKRRQAAPFPVVTGFDLGFGRREPLFRFIAFTGAPQ